MNIGRGYQSSTTIGDGRIFTIGGSWNGGLGGKNGEIYNTATNVWTYLPGADVSRILTEDSAGIFRSDNHAWLFAWKLNSVFHAGPSKAMNWFNVSGSGSWVSAGNRATDNHAMNGIAVMYDAVAGLIVTAGGAVDYQEKPASVASYVIQLGTPNTIPVVTQGGNLAYPRAYCTGTVLPDGKVLIVGGQSWPIPLAENDSQFFAELWNPTTRAWTTVAPAASPRNYHSISILLPDATVASGGSGLCGFDCTANHFDFHIYMPPYLFTAQGQLAARPTIVSVSATSRSPGQTLQVTTDTTATFALIRHGSSTHTVNTDQVSHSYPTSGLISVSFIALFPL
jgi:galactose oxidase